MISFDPPQNGGCFVTGRPMPKTPSLGRCNKNTCFWYILKQEQVRLKDCAGVRKARENWTVGACFRFPDSARRPQQGSGCRTLARVYREDCPSRIKRQLRGCVHKIQRGIIGGAA